MKILNTLKETNTDGLDLVAFNEATQASAPYLLQAKQSLSGKMRQIQEVFADCEELWKSPINYQGTNLTGPEAFLRFTCQLRTITRNLKLPNGNIIVPAIGDGMRNEFVLRLMWLIINHRATFMENILTFFNIGSARDWFELWRRLLQIRNDKGGMYLSNQFMTSRTLKMMEGEDKDMILKYMPTMATKSACNTIHKQANNIIASCLAKAIFVKDGKVWDEAIDPEHKGEGFPLMNGVLFNPQARAILQKNYRLLKKQSEGNVALRIVASLPTTEEKEEKVKELEMVEIPSRLKYIWTHRRNKKDGKTFEERHGLVLSRPNRLFKLMTTFEDWHTPTVEERSQFEKALFIHEEGIPKMLTFCDVSDPNATVSNLSFFTLCCLYSNIVNLGLRGTIFENELLTFNKGVFVHNVTGETLLDRITDSLPIQNELVDVNPPSLVKVAAFLKLVKQLDIDENTIPNKLLLIVNASIKIDEEEWNNFQKLLSESFSKEFVDKMEVVIWNPTNKPSNFRVFNAYIVNGLNRDLIDYICGITSLKANSLKQKAFYDLHVPAKKKRAARQSRNK